jgi:shikimate dehydrogenase
MKRACIIGWPVNQSRSPIIHGHWLKTYGIAGSYDRAAVPPGEAAAFIRSLGERGLEGCNVTAPHKQAVFEAADWRDPSAEAFGAANTVWREGSKVCVANTDTYGFVTHLRQSVPDWDKRDAPVAIFGAGGAARARGHRTVDGLGMLLHQAVPGFARWFGVRPEVTPTLRDILVADIEGR